MTSHKSAPNPMPTKSVVKPASKKPTKKVPQRDGLAKYAREVAKKLR